MRPNIKAWAAKKREPGRWEKGQPGKAVKERIFKRKAKRLEHEDMIRAIIKDNERQNERQSELRKERKSEREEHQFNVTRGIGVRGDSIAGSMFMRDFCMYCSEPIRVNKLLPFPLCSDCRPTIKNYYGGKSTIEIAEIQYSGGNFHSGEW